MDLLRSMAVMLVILGHTVLSYGAPGWLAPLQFGGTGVDLFFVLSGWLLGGQLFKEHLATGSIDLARFWSRRWMRTLPAYYVILILSVIQRYLTKENVDFPWQYFFFLQNYIGGLEFFSISWSLCVEEQFYLVIAPLVLFSASINRRVTIFLLLAMLILPFIFRQMNLYGSIEQTHVRVDCCVAGVVLAYIRYHHKELWVWLSGRAGYFAVGALVVYLSIYIFRYLGIASLSNPDKTILAAIFSCWVVAANSGLRWQKLSLPGSYYIATRSYALYLVHPEVLSILRRFADLVPFFVYFGLAVVGSLIFSEVLYRVVEKPFIDAREKFSISRNG